jgi:GGDEF domain-containing protein
VGVARAAPSSPYPSLEQLLAAADQAMYRVKQNR